MKIPAHIKELGKMSPAVEKEIGSLFKRHEFPKGYILFNQDEICKHVYYVEKGLARVFYNSQNGKDITIWFAADQSFITAIESFYHNNPSRDTCELLEDSVVYSISFDDMDKMLNKNHHLAKFAFHSLFEITKTMAVYMFNIKFQNAKEKYNTLLKMYPQIFQRVQLQHIASFLGITPETLSRLRAEK